MRAFVAVPVSSKLALELLAVRDDLLADIPSSQPRAVPAANFHLTLAFLGDIDADRVDALDALLSTVAAECMPFQQPLTEVAAFPTARDRIVAAQGRAVDDLSVLHRRLWQRLSMSGFEQRDEQALRPHVTLARLRLPVVPPVRVACQLMLDVTALVLFESVQRQGRAVYRPLRRAELFRAVT